MSTFWYESTQGTMKKMPGPRAPPLSSRPSRKMTTRSYSCTTLTAKQSDTGSVMKIRMMEQKVMRYAQMPGPSSHAARRETMESWILTVDRQVEVCHVADMLCCGGLFTDVKIAARATTTAATRPPRSHPQKSAGATRGVNGDESKSI